MKRKNVKHFYKHAQHASADATRITQLQVCDSLADDVIAIACAGMCHLHLSDMT